MYLQWVGKGEKEIGDHEVATSLLHKLEAALRGAIQADSSWISELRLLLIDSFSRLKPPDPRLNWEWVHTILTSGNYESMTTLTAEILKFTFEKAPNRVGMFLGRHPAIVQEFFEGDPQRIDSWFAHFNPEGLSHFHWGAKPLATYALSQRDQVWKHLVWGGRHPQAPVAVATKIHYFCELEVTETVKNLLEECPLFWSSNDFRACLEDGQILSLDPTFFAEGLAKRFISDEMVLDSDLEETLKRVFIHLETCDWGYRILVNLSDADIVTFLRRIAKIQGGCKRDPRILPEHQAIFLSWECFTDLLLANALARHQTAFHDTIKEDEELREEILAYCLSLHTDASIHKEQCRLFLDVKRLSDNEAFMVCWLEIFSLQFSLSHEMELGGARKICLILEDNGTRFRVQNTEEKYALLETSDESDDMGKSEKRKRRKHKKRKKSRSDSRNVESEMIWDIFLSDQHPATCHGTPQLVDALIDRAIRDWWHRSFNGSL